MPYTEPLSEEEIIPYLKNSIEPLSHSPYGKGYRASVYLVDGTYLPCVIFRNSQTITELAMRRFEEEKKGKSTFSKSSGFGYGEIVKTFVTKGGCINSYDVAKVELSPYAIPNSVLKLISGETAMGWTGFVLRMKDDQHFGFGTSFSFEFFDLPEGYNINDIKEVINNSYIGVDGSIKSYRDKDTSDYPRSNIFRERIYFECYIDGL